LCRACEEQGAPCSITGCSFCWRMCLSWYSRGGTIGVPLKGKVSMLHTLHHTQPALQATTPIVDTDGDNQQAPRSHGERWPGHHLALVPFLGLSLLALILAGCGTSSAPGGATSPTAAPGGGTVKVYFAKHPDTDNNPTAVFAAQRTTSATTTQDRATFALEELLKGPTPTERSQGNYYSPFDGQLGLQSACPGTFRDFDLTLDHRGTTAEPGTATLQLCRRVDIAGDLDGARMKAMITATLTQFPTIQRVIILNYQGNCFDDIQGQNACLKASTGGYSVVVYFSKHPDSDTAPAKVFAIERVSPTLQVAAYAVGQLIAGPTSAEKSAGYYTPLAGSLSGPSTCNGADFTIMLNRNRTHTEDGSATLQFCRAVPGFGDTGSAIVRNEITRTLTQFPTIQKVVIIYQDGSCFDDLTGCN
jgi:spore germination protein GerM